MSSNKRLVQSIEDLWRGHEPSRSRPHDSTSFQRLMETCAELFPEEVGTIGKTGKPDLEGVGWALHNFFRAIGSPWITNGAVAELLPTPEQAAEALTRAMTMSETEVIHLCPLDQADSLPHLKFGPCEIRRFSQSELNAIVQPSRLKRWNSNWTFDGNAFAQFFWLAIYETRDVSKPVGTRAMPIIYEDINFQFGDIIPHKGIFPELIEKALFAAILLPWEMLTDYSDLEWRGFRVPWTYSVDRDPFARPIPPPRPETLSWELQIQDDPVTGEEVEGERPFMLSLKEGSQTPIQGLTNEKWSEISAALGADLFNPLVLHFLVRAFLSNGIDEFLNHLTALEAALGQKEDYQAGSGRRSVKRRIAKISGRPEAANEYEDVFDVRSEFVHGRKMKNISADKRLIARRLAREVADKLVLVAAANPKIPRDRFLNELLS